MLAGTTSDDAIVILTSAGDVGTANPSFKESSHISLPSTCVGVNEDKAPFRINDESSSREAGSVDTVNEEG